MADEYRATCVGGEWCILYKGRVILSFGNEGSKSEAECLEGDFNLSECVADLDDLLPFLEGFYYAQQ